MLPLSLPKLLQEEGGVGPAGCAQARRPAGGRHKEATEAPEVIAASGLWLVPQLPLGLPNGCALIWTQERALNSKIESDLIVQQVFCPNENP